MSGHEITTGARGGGKAHRLTATQLEVLAILAAADGTPVETSTHTVPPGKYLHEALIAGVTATSLARRGLVEYVRPGWVRITAEGRKHAPRAAVEKCPHCGGVGSGCRCTT